MQPQPKDKLTSKLPDSLPHLRYSESLKMQQSPLLLLPAELRRKIYDCVLNDWQVKLYGNRGPSGSAHVICNDLDKPADERDFLMPSKSIAALAATCRQLHSETQLLQWSHVEFAGRDRGESSLKRLLERINDDQRARVTSGWVFADFACEQTPGCPINFEDGFCAYLRSLSGLKRVVVEVPKLKSRQRWKSFRRDIWKQMSEEIPGVEIVVDSS